MDEHLKTLLATAQRQEHKGGIDGLVGGSRALEEAEAAPPPAASDSSSGTLRTGWSVLRSLLLDNASKITDSVPAGAEDEDEDGNSTTLDEHWLDERVSQYASSTEADESSSLPLSTIKSRIRELLASLASEDELQNDLLDLLGYGDLDFVMDLIRYRTTVHRTTSSSGRSINTNADRDRKKENRANDISKLTGAELQTLREHERTSNSQRPLASGGASKSDGPPHYPHVYSNMAHGNTLSVYGTKFALPAETKRAEGEFYEEITIPPSRPAPAKRGERLIHLNELDNLCRASFQGYTSLNRIQSLVYPIAYGTNENMLVCAPTGAGKTDVAMLTVLRTLSQYMTLEANFNRKDRPEPRTDEHKYDISSLKDVKIVYVAPMKALAAEVVRKMSKRLKWLGIRVRELTGDMQLTRAEISDTHFIVTTPEKWDVVTRKPTGEGMLASLVKLLIIDEVHLLNDDRGAVIESIVARTLRHVESSQSLIRIVGLSATLPNYIDVAEFLRVNPFQGMFYFDSGFRPVPLEQHFIGVKGKAGSQASRTNLNKAAFEKVAALVKDDHPCMVFVHSRKETVKTAQSLKESASLEGILEFFDPTLHPKYQFYKHQVSQSKNKELRELFESGFGIHHAGMLRADRNLSEQLFEQGLVKVLCCTATLAWGVNLPAYAVIIKGTQLYDSNKGTFVDLSILDVLQIFGRAGRPQFEDLGVGYICTTSDKLSHYVGQITMQHPIESTFIENMVDSLNAEISLGTVSNVEEAVQWLGYTYLFVRMRRNPFVYGMDHDELAHDPVLAQKRQHLIRLASEKLSSARMIDFVAGHQYLTRDQGRIASKYYISHATIEMFNQMMKPIMSEEEILAMLSMSKEFEQIKVRENEQKELDKLTKDHTAFEIKSGGSATSQGKVNILLQSYIARAYLEDFALVSDCAYVAQNSGRILRALFEIALANKYAQTALVLSSLCKSVEKRIWAHDHPLLQFSLKPEVQIAISRWADDLTVAELCEHSPEELGKLIHMNDKIGSAVLNVARQFPSLDIRAIARPISPDMLQIDLDVRVAFTWNEKVHGPSQTFWVWLEDETEETILQFRRVTFQKGGGTTQQAVTFCVVSPTKPSMLHVRTLSDQWLAAEILETIDLEHVFMPLKDSVPALPNLPFLPITALQNSRFESFYRIQGREYFTRMQTTAFFDLYQLDRNVFCSVSNPSELLDLAEIALFRASQKHAGTKVLMLVNDDRAKADIVTIWSRRRLEHIGYRAQRAELPIGRGVYSPVIIATPDDLMNAERMNAVAFPETFSLVIYTAIEDMSVKKELAIMHVKRMMSGRISTRQVVLGQPLWTTAALARWLNIPSLDVFPFKQQDRPSPCETEFLVHEELRPSNILQILSKPTYLACRSLCSSGSILIVAPSAHTAIGLAVDLKTQAAVTFESDTFLGPTASPSAIADMLLSVGRDNLEDNALHETLSSGIGFMALSSAPSTKSGLRDLWVQGAFNVLIIERRCATWSQIAKGASHVIVSGTRYSHLSQGIDNGGGQRRYRRVQEYSCSEILNFQAFAEVHPLRGTPNKVIVMCSQDGRDLYQKLLNEGLPVHSALAGSQSQTCNTLACVVLWALSSRVASGKMNSNTLEACCKADLTEWLSESFFGHSICYNPSYYGILGMDPEMASTGKSGQGETLDHVLGEAIKLLKSRKLIFERGQDSLEPTLLGHSLAQSIFPFRLDEADEILDSVSAMIENDWLELARRLAQQSKNVAFDASEIAELAQIADMLDQKKGRIKSTSQAGEGHFSFASNGDVTNVEDGTSQYNTMLMAAAADKSMSAALKIRLTAALREYLGRLFGSFSNMHRALRSDITAGKRGVQFNSIV